ncbi:MAG: MBL fold metallo-hydrolase, partial [Anaerolineae bacterium]|nr:MBL fold metallo-hydrolase [Anaerolineae bacterium]
MIRIESIDEAYPVVRFVMARDIAGWTYYQTAAYWVDGLLIDTGCAHTAPQFAQALKSLEVSQVVNTHSHEDHIGANADVQDLFGCPILAHAEALPILENPKLQPLQPYRRVSWGWPRPSQGTEIGDWVETERCRFHIVHTPGH